MEKPKVSFAEDLIVMYKAFKNRVYSPKSVLYPSCDFDASPARVFDNVTFVDINKKCIAALKKEGFKAFAQDISSYKPAEAHDLLILLNPAIPTKWASQHLVSNGWVIANNYHSNATEMYREPAQFLLWGTMDFAEEDRRKGDNKVVISRNLEDLFQPVKDTEDFKKFQPTDFEFTSKLIEHWIKQGILKVDSDAPFEEKWAEYRKIMKEEMPYKRNAERYIFIKK